MTLSLIPGLLLVCLLVVPPLVSSQDFLLVGYLSIFDSSSGIFKYFPSSGRWQKLPISTGYGALALTYDPVNDRVIWVDYPDDVVYSARADGRDKKVVTRFEDDDVAIRALQYDWSTGLLFYTRHKNSASDSAGKLIVRHIDTGKEVELLSIPFYAPNELSLDHDDKNIYYSNPLFSRVERANFDISNRTSFLTSDHVETPTALHYDDDNQYLYVCDFKDQGDNVTVCTRWTWTQSGTSYGVRMRQTRVGYVEGVGDQLYFTDSIKQELRVLTFGENALDRRVSGQPRLGFPFGIYYHKQNYRTYANPCETARCGENELCVPTSRSGYSCLCTTGATCSDEPTTTNECERDNHGCEHHCRDTDDSYYCSCRTGYTLQADGRGCRDLDECQEGSHSCAQECSNTEGSFSCSCRSGFTLASNREGCIEVDRNECQDGTAWCDHGCVDTPSSYYCTCRAGYRLSSNGHSCEDIDECQEGSYTCSDFCSNTAGSYTCRCRSGSSLAPDRQSCVASASNECATDNGGCEHDCRDTSGSYYCACRPGYRLMNNRRNCQDINECLDGIHACSQVCSNTAGSYTCRCRSGSSLAPDGQSCVASESNECATDNGGCEHDCRDTSGSYYCTCRPGYRLMNNRRNCQDINECLDGIHACSQVCSNTAGSYSCRCRPGYYLAPDRRTCVAITTEAPVPTTAGPSRTSGTISDCRGPDLSNPAQFDNTYFVQRGLAYTDNSAGAPLKSGTIRGVQVVGVREGPVMLAVFTPDPVWGAVKQTLKSLTTITVGASGLQTFAVNIAVRDNDRIGMVMDNRGTVPVGIGYVSSYSGFSTNPTLPLTSGDSVGFSIESSRVFAINFCYEFSGSSDVGPSITDDCAVSNGGCEHSCHDTSSSYYCTCRTGFSLGADGRSCTANVASPQMTCEAGGGICVSRCFNPMQRGTCPSGFSCCPPGSCGGRYTESSGDLLSPNFPLNYTTHLLCNYVVNAPSGFLKLTVKMLQTQDDKDCSLDYVAILDGYGPQVARLCGDIQDHRGLTVMVQGPSASVIFASDHAVGDQGFYIEYQSQTCRDVGGTCAGSCSHGDFSSSLGCAGGRQCCQPAALYPQCSEPPPMVGMIVGGDEAERHGWPWMVSVQSWEQTNSRTYSASHICGGILIDPSWVLTAAHCVDNQDSVAVMGGEHDISKNSGTEYRVRVHSNNIRLHPKFQRNVGFKWGDGDIALIKLPRPVPLSSRLYPVCLTSPEVTFTERDECQVTGWGRAGENGPIQPLLQEAEVNLVPLDRCRQLYDSRRAGFGHFAVHDSIICAGGQGEGTCSGDSGGPLVCRKSPRDKYHVVGVTSTSTNFGCGVLPERYTNVANYRDWILMHTLNS